MTRKSLNSKFNSRLSAGGANKTNIQGQMSRLNEPESLSSQRPNSSDLMPVPRRSSFQPWNSRLVAHRRVSPEPPHHWEPASMLPPQPRFGNRQDRMDYLLDDKGRPVPKRGMFLNAKYSEDIRPMINEARIHETEQLIRRFIRPIRHEQQQQRDNLQNDDLRNLVRQAVYDLGVPQNYCVPAGVQHQQNHHIHRDCDSRRRQRDFNDNYTWENERHSRAELRDVPKKKRVRNETAEKFFVESSNQSGPSERRSQQSEGEEEDEDEEREEEDVREKSPSSRRSNSSRRNEEVAACPQKYIKDPDECDNWKGSLPFMCQPNGAGAAMLARIGSAIPNLPLKDNTENSYAKVAMMLLSDRIKNMSNPQKNRKQGEEGPQTQLLNMSTSWVRNVNSNEKASEGKTTMMNEVSRIHNPQNVVMEDESLFRNSHVFGPEAISEQVEMKKKKKNQFDPLFHSSPISNDVFRTSGDGLTIPSSIRKDLCREESDEEEPPTEQHDVDDYTAQGASQLTFSRTPEVFSAENPSSGLSDHSNHSPEIIEETNEPSQSFNKTKSSRSLHFNSRFSFSSVVPKKKKKKTSTGSQPVLDFDEETQKMFDAVYDNENNKKKFSF